MGRPDRRQTASRSQIDLRNFGNLQRSFPNQDPDQFWLSMPLGLPMCPFSKRKSHGAAPATQECNILGNHQGSFPDQDPDQFWPSTPLGLPVWLFSNRKSHMAARATPDGKPISDRFVRIWQPPGKLPRPIPRTILAEHAARASHVSVFQ